MVRKVFVAHAFRNAPDYNRNLVDNFCRKVTRRSSEYLLISPLHFFSFIDDEEPFRDTILEVTKKIISTLSNDDMFLQLSFSEGCLAERKEAEKYGLDIVTLQDAPIFLQDCYEEAVIEADEKSFSS